MAPVSTVHFAGESKANRTAHPSAGMTPKPPTTKRDTEKGKTETRRRADSVAQSSRYIPSQSRMETNRDTLRPTERGTERDRTHRPSERHTERERTYRPSERETRRGDSTNEALQSRFENKSVRDHGSRAPRTERDHRDLESSTTATIKPGSVIGADSISTSTSRLGTRRNRDTRFDTANLPTTIYEDEPMNSRAPASRYDTVKAGRLVPYDAKSRIGHGSLFDASSRGQSQAYTSYNDGAMTRTSPSYGGGASSYYGDEGTMTRRADKTFSGMMRDEVAKSGTTAVQGTQVKIETGSGTKIEVNILDVTRKR